MGPLTRSNLRGNWGTLLLPIGPDDGILWDRLAQEVDILAAAGVDGIYSNGTAGEFHNQTEAEFDRIQQLLAAGCSASGTAFQIGASHPCPVISRERVRRTVPLRPAAFQVVLPDWVATGEEEQDRFLDGIAEAAAGIPLVLYNPPHAKTPLHPERLEAIAARHPAVIGVKVAGGGGDWYRRMAWSRGRFSVFVPGHLLASGLRTGIADGAYSNVACLSPAGAQQWWRLMQADIEAAIDVERRILAFFAECITPFQQAGYSNPALDKLLAAAGGWAPVGTRLRWPYRWIPEGEAGQVGRRARHWLPELFAGEG
jgi:dihydrodipicolinate synthase/N-acetylneuraminate lyase